METSLKLHGMHEYRLLKYTIAMHQLTTRILILLGPNGDGAIRLVRNGFTSPDYTSGVVQVWWNGQWGNICDDSSFGFDEADVICHHLGWSGASSYTTSQLDG